MFRESEAAALSNRFMRVQLSSISQTEGVCMNTLPGFTAESAVRTAFTHYAGALQKSEGQLDLIEPQGKFKCPTFATAIAIMFLPFGVGSLIAGAGADYLCVVLSER